MISSPDITLALARGRWGGIPFCRQRTVRARRLLFFPRGFPNLSQRAVSAIYRIVIGNWQSRDVVIGSGSLAWLTPKQIPFASIGVSSNNGKVRAGADILVSHTGWNYDQVPGIHLDVAAVLAADPQGRSTAINSQGFMRGAVIMSEGIDAVSPRVGPVVL